MMSRNIFRRQDPTQIGLRQSVRRQFAFGFDFSDVGLLEGIFRWGRKQLGKPYTGTTVRGVSRIVWLLAFLTELEQVNASPQKQKY